MSAVFASGSSQYLLNSAAPITAMPWSAGMWIKPTQTAAAQSVFGLADSGTANNYWLIQWNGPSGIFQFWVQAGGTAVAANSAAANANEWHYVVARAISATNRRMSVLLSTGASSHVQNTTSRTPSGIDNMTLGCVKTTAVVQLFDGEIAEFWLANVDIQADGAQLQESVLRQLAYGGPFSVPRVASNLIDYRSLLSSLGSNEDVLGESLVDGPKGRQVWDNISGVQRRPHPPLSPSYLRPPQQTALFGMQ